MEILANPSEEAEDEEIISICCVIGMGGDTCIPSDS